MQVCHSEKLENMFRMQFERIEVSCEKHGKISVDVPAGFDKECPCPVCEQEEEERALREREKAVHARRLEKMGVRKRYFNSSFDNYHPQTAKAKDFLDLLKDSIESKDSKAFLLYGSSGTGKTHLCSAAVGARGGKYTTWEWLSIEIRASYAKAAQKTEADILREICTTPFLVIDEIDKGTDSESKRNTLSFICRERYENCLPTWLSGNCNAEWVGQMLDSSVIDRLKEGGQSLCFDWESYRKNQRGTNE